MIWGFGKLVVVVVLVCLLFLFRGVGVVFGLVMGVVEMLRVVGRVFMLGFKFFIVYFRLMLDVWLFDLVWGVKEVGVCDFDNGFEDLWMMYWNYWDG